MRRHEREVSNSDRVRGTMPLGVHQLADYAAHDIAELCAILNTAPPAIRPHLEHIADTMQRLTCYVEAIADETEECALRIAARGQSYEEAMLASVAHTSPVPNIGEMLLVIFERSAKQRGGSTYGPGQTRSRGMGFQRGADDGRDGT